MNVLYRGKLTRLVYNSHRKYTRKFKFCDKIVLDIYGRFCRKFFSYYLKAVVKWCCNFIQLPE